MSVLTSIFIGVPQSRYAAIAILLAIASIALIILFRKGPRNVSTSSKLWIIAMMFFVSLPSLAMALFQLTCIVTGAGAKNSRWWCSAYAWIVSALVIFYSGLLILAIIMGSSKESFFADAATKEDHPPYSVKVLGGDYWCPVESKDPVEATFVREHPDCVKKSTPPSMIDFFKEESYWKLKVPDIPVEQMYFIFYTDPTDNLVTLKNVPQNDLNNARVVKNAIKNVGENFIEFTVPEGSLLINKISLDELNIIQTQGPILTLSRIVKPSI